HDGMYFLLLMIVIVGVIPQGQTDKYRSQHGKNISLKKYNQCFQSVNKDRERRGHRCNKRRLEEENKSDERHQYNVARRHVRKQTYRQSKRLGKQTDDLDGYHDRPQPPRSAA